MLLNSRYCWAVREAIEMPKKGDRYECGACGLEVECVEGCGCGVCGLICCGKPMKAAAAKPKKAAKKK